MTGRWEISHISDESSIIYVVREIYMIAAATGDIT